MSVPEARPTANPAIVRWLGCVAILVFAMIMLGGVTRLTESGLSMVEWRPVTGWLPPMTEQAWQAELDKYRATPEYRYKNAGFSVEDFKTIFWFEYLHRLLGRLIGVAFALPFFWFLARKAVPRPLKPHLWILLALGGAQGVLGWYMVKSGLVDQPAVSQYRLAAHLGLAFFIYGYIVWLVLNLKQKVPGWPYAGALVLMGLVYLQVLSGAFVAGLDAGFIYNTWPAIDGAVIPPDILTNPPFWPGVFEDHRTVQFMHRMMAYAITLYVALWWLRNRGDGWTVHAVGLATVYQVLAGIVTLLYLPYVPAWLAVFHQAGAVVLLTTVIYAAARLKRPAEAGVGRAATFTG
ncbi:MAG: COX15/CtaA family protein [Alphaproteobacteria bacterium]